MIKGNTVFEGSVIGLTDKIENKTVILKAEVQQRKEPVAKEGVVPVKDTSGRTKPVVLTIKEIVGGVAKDIYIPLLDMQERPLQYISSSKSLVQNWNTATIETDTPSEVEVTIMDYIQLFQQFGACACKELGLDPEHYPVKFTSYSPYSKTDNLWLTSPESQKSTIPWTFDSWSAQSGTPTMKVSGISVITADQSAKSGNKENYLSLHFKLGLHKFDPEFVSKKKKRDDAYAAGEDVSVPPKALPVMSEAAKKLRSTKRSKVLAEGSASAEDCVVA
jgi:hypothetical protein